MCIKGLNKSQSVEGRPPAARAPQRKESLEVPEQSVSSKSHYPVIKRSKSQKAMTSPGSALQKKPLKRSASLRMFLGKERLRKSWIDHSSRRRTSLEVQLSME